MSRSNGRIPDPQVLASGIGATCCLFRLALDIIQATYDENRQNFNRLLKYDDASGARNNTNDKDTNKNQQNGSLLISSTTTTTTNTRKLQQQNTTNHRANGINGVHYGTFRDKQAQALFPMDIPSDGEEVQSSSLRPLLIKGDTDVDSLTGTESAEENNNNYNIVTKAVAAAQEANTASITEYSTFVHSVIVAFLLLDLCFSSSSQLTSPLRYHTGPLLCASFSSFSCLILNRRDSKRQRFSCTQRVFYLTSSLSLLYGGYYAVFFCYPNEDKVTFSTSTWDLMALLSLSLYMIICLWECKTCPFPTCTNHRDGKNVLSRKAILTMLRPYFWPDAEKDASICDSVSLNRIRAILTWICVALAKVCLLIAPVLIGRASTALTRMEYVDSIKYLAIYCTAIFSSNFLKEAQGLLYLKVSQTAFIQLSEIVFNHLHSLSLDWHLNRKLGEGEPNCCASYIAVNRFYF
jgi:hypothetical protein